MTASFVAAACTRLVRNVLHETDPYYYAIGNVRGENVVQHLTASLAPSLPHDRLDILLAGCGDIRNVVETVHAEKKGVCLARDGKESACECLTCGGKMGVRAMSVVRGSAYALPVVGIEGCVRRLSPHFCGSIFQRKVGILDLGSWCGLNT